MEQQIDRFGRPFAGMDRFVIPSGVMAAVQLQLARAVGRRAERAAIAACRHRPLRHELLAFLNRLSSLPFVLGLWVSWSEGVQERAPEYRRAAPWMIEGEAPRPPPRIGPPSDEDSVVVRSGRAPPLSLRARGREPGSIGSRRVPSPPDRSRAAPDSRSRERFRNVSEQRWWASWLSTWARVAATVARPGPGCRAPRTTGIGYDRNGSKGAPDERNVGVQGTVGI